MDVRVGRLQERLDGITERTRALVPAEKLEPAERMVAELFASGVEERVLGVGAVAPGWELEDVAGRRVRWEDLLAVGPVVVNFFRGRWCPYCVGELEAWGEVYDRVRAKGGLLVGVSPQTVRQNAFTAEGHGVRFPLLSDPGLRVAEGYGLAWEVPEGFRRYLRGILVNVPYVNGEGSWRLPVPGTFVVGRDGRVKWGKGYADWRVRVEPEEVLGELEGL